MMEIILFISHANPADIGNYHYGPQHPMKVRFINAESNATHKPVHGIDILLPIVAAPDTHGAQSYHQLWTIQEIGDSCK